MIKTRLILASFLFAYSCTNSIIEKNANNNDSRDSIIIISKELSSEIAGEAYRKRATQYAIIRGNDTSAFCPIVEQSNENKLLIDLNLPYQKQDRSFANRLQELSLILHEMHKTYTIDSIRHIQIGRLILTGSYAINTSHVYYAQYGEGIRTGKDYGNLSAMLKNGSLAEALNTILHPYNLEVKGASIEKAFFTSKDEMLKCAGPISDTIAIPDKVLDCMLWFTLQRKQ